MNTTEQNQFFAFLEEQLSKYNDVYPVTENYINKGLYFYAYANTQVHITSTGSNINFSFQEEISNTKNNTILSSVDISFEDCQPFMERLFKVYYDKHIAEWLRPTQPHYEWAITELDNIHEYLKKAPIQKMVDDKSIIEIPHKNKNHQILAGQVLKYGDPYLAKECGFAGMTVLKFVLFPNEKEHVYLELPVPGWKVQDYPCLAPFIKVDKASLNLDQLLTTLKEKNPELGGMLHYNILNNLLPDDNVQIKKHKL
jgi:hypothetical protein